MVFFSRRFSRKEPTIVMAFHQCFLRPPELTKIVQPKVLQNFQKTPKCTCWPKDMNQKGFLRTIQYRTRSKGPPLDFFGTVRLFQKKNSPSKRPSSIVLSFTTERMLENPKGSSLSVFFGIVRLFSIFFHKRVPNSPIL